VRYRERDAASGLRGPFLEHALVIAYHLIWTAYGWWLPNDPRGSGSRVIRNELLAELGDLHYGRKRLQPTGREVGQFYHAAADLLKHPLLTFNKQQRALIADAFAVVIERERYTCYACAVMPDHVHILIRKHKHHAEELAERLQDASRQKLIAAGYRAPTHPVWIACPGWSVFLDHPQEVRRTIGYIEANPLKIGLPAHRWPFVQGYDNWPLHEGHSQNSPYAKRLRALGRYPL
jgi:REP element-mobilizing transposase RayT